MKCKFDFIEKFDMFGKSIGLYYDGHQKKKIHCSEYYSH